MSLESQEVSVQKAVNTRRLQLFELSLFMVNERGAIFDGVCFTNPDDFTQYSFSQAVEMFNSRDQEEKDLGEYVCEKVKVRYCKKQKKIACTNHFIKFAKEFKDACADDGIDPLDAMRHIQKRLRLR